MCRSSRLSDYSTALNHSLKKAEHGFTCAKVIRESLNSPAKYYTVLDLPHAYFQIPLTENASERTAFVADVGTGAYRYVYLIAPMGLSCTSDHFNRVTDNIFAGLPGVKKLIDDILVEADSMEQMEERLEEVLKQAEEHDVTLSRSKTQFGQKVRLGGFVVESKDDIVSVSPSPDLLADIKNFKTPTNKTEIRAYTGLAKQVTDFNPDISQSI